MSLLEWLGESYNPGEIGSVDSEKPIYKAKPRYIVLIKLIISLFIIGLLYYIIFENVPSIEITEVIKITVGLIIYLLLGFFITPKPDYDNVGLMGGLIDHPFRISDDYNRALVFFKAFLWPGKFISVSIRDFIILIKSLIS